MEWLLSRRHSEAIGIQCGFSSNKHDVYGGFEHVLSDGGLSSI